MMTHAIYYTESKTKNHNARVPSGDYKSVHKVHVHMILLHAKRIEEGVCRHLLVLMLSPIYMYKMLDLTEY